MRLVVNNLINREKAVFHLQEVLTSIIVTSVQLPNGNAQHGHVLSSFYGKLLPGLSVYRERHPELWLEDPLT